ncbi:MAG: 50S ribosomal protein L2 [Candidatus Doudnabacteria bacterium]|nr:50S ribosomal protein L2 [Candidatus Doudnabacteria bacterium]MCA9387686.1 50S ribosomal protein L2 [Candidatus Andersenbacteria bacterium]
MPVKTYKPTTPARRYMSTVRTDELTTKRNTPKKSLTTGGKRAAGRSKGRITTRHKGAGVKRKYRTIDMKMDLYDVPMTVQSVEYDPYRSAWIALVEPEGHPVRYILATDGMKQGDVVLSSQNKLEPEVGNRMPLKFIPEGMEICAVELQPGRGAQMVKSAGTFVTILSKEDDAVQIKLPSGEVRLFRGDCRATMGRMSNKDHGKQVIGKAGRVRMMGKRPSVRGKAMNPVDHPHGGGEAGTSIGMKHPKTPWGRPALGVKTRKKKKASNRVIIRRRPKKRK